MTKAVVWSKDSCPFCVQAKALLEAVPDARTLPQIFLDKEYIGGFTELRKHLQG